MHCDDTHCVICISKKVEYLDKEENYKTPQRTRSNFEHSIRNEMSIKARVHTAKNAKICYPQACYSSFQAT